MKKIPSPYKKGFFNVQEINLLSPNILQYIKYLIVNQVSW